MQRMWAAFLAEALPICLARVSECNASNESSPVLLYHNAIQAMNLGSFSCHFSVTGWFTLAIPATRAERRVSSLRAARAPSHFRSLRERMGDRLEIDGSYEFENGKSGGSESPAPLGPPRPADCNGDLNEAGLGAVSARGLTTERFPPIKRPPGRWTNALHLLR